MECIGSAVGNPSVKSIHSVLGAMPTVGRICSRAPVGTLSSRRLALQSTQGLFRLLEMSRVGDHSVGVGDIQHGLRQDRQMLNPEIHPHYRRQQAKGRGVHLNLD